MTWDTGALTNDQGEVYATRLSLGAGGVAWPEGREREVSAVDWGKDLVSLLHLDSIVRLNKSKLAACSDDLAARIWRPNREVATALFSLSDKKGMSSDWVGAN